MNIDKKKMGYMGEEKSYLLLKEKGISIIARNYHSPYGEIDIIGIKENTLIFVEVKTRSSSVTNCLNSVSKSKQKKLVKTALYFLSKNQHYENFFTRFDVICVILKDNKYKLFHFDDCFTP